MRDPVIRVRLHDERKSQIAKIYFTAMASVKYRPQNLIWLISNILNPVAGDAISYELLLDLVIELRLELDRAIASTIGKDMPDVFRLYSGLQSRVDLYLVVKLLAKDSSVDIRDNRANLEEILQEWMNNSLDLLESPLVEESHVAVAELATVKRHSLARFLYLMVQTETANEGYIYEPPTRLVLSKLFDPNQLSGYDATAFPIPLDDTVIERLDGLPLFTYEVFGGVVNLGKSEAEVLAMQQK